jgi:two-component system sensor histidine kinase KdpD
MVRVAYLDPRLGACADVACASLLTVAITHFRTEVGLLDTGLIFLALTLLAASLWGIWVGILAAGVNYFCLNFFFIEPLHKIVIHDPKNLGAWFLEVSLFLGVAIVASRRGP